VSAPSICRTCGAALAEKKGTRSCPRGCQIVTAQPVGAEYATPRSMERDGDGRLWETGGAVGSLRRLPTCKE